MRRILILALMGLSAFAQAQVLRIDKDHLRSDSSGFAAATIDLNFAIDNRSNSSSEKLVYTRLSSRADVLYVSENHAYILANAIDYLSTTGAQPLSYGYTHARMVFRRRKAVSYETFAQVQYDESRRMLFRLTGGGGWRVTPIDRNKTDVHFGFGPFYEKEKWREVAGDESSDFTAEFIKLYLYTGMEFVLHENVSTYIFMAINTGYDTDADYFRNRFFTEVNLTFRISRRLSWINRFNLQYDARPLIEINPGAYALFSGLRITF